MDNVVKKTQGRRKIKIKKIEKKSDLQVAFSKRRPGLFKKASELALLCGAQIGILVESPAGKIYSCGYPSVDALILPFLTADAPPPPPAMHPSISHARSGYEEAVTRLQMEKKKRESWWNEPYEAALERHQLEEYLEALQILTDEVSKRADAKATPQPNSSSHEEATSSVSSINSIPCESPVVDYDDDLFDILYTPRPVDYNLYDIL